jgi:nitrogen fixation protein NifB
LWERIHLPVAPYCNIKCIFCDHQIGASCHIPKPGFATRVMSPSEAIKRFGEEYQRRPNLHIAAISGPGEPLANPQSFETLRGIRDINEDIEFCLSTNGTLLSDHIDELRDLNVRVISVSISTLNPDTAIKIYEWVIHDGMKFRGKQIGDWIIHRQLAGIKDAVESGIMVKVNSILIPGVNDLELENLAQSLSDIGVKLQNIIPLVPYANAIKFRAPSLSEINSIREKAAYYLKQFKHCAQCRSDVVGIPGDDTVL